VTVGVARAVAKTRYKHLITSYDEDAALFRTGVRRLWFAALLAGLALAPLVGSAIGGDYVPYLLNMAGIAVIVALGLNLLTGSAGLVSLGHAAFLAIGAYTAAFLATRVGFPFWMTVTIAGGVTGLVGLVVGLPALRLRGLYLALATLAFQMIVGHVALRWESVTGGPNGSVAPPPALGGFVFDDATRFYYITATLAVLLALGVANLMRSRFGRALVAIRDSDVAAEAMGVHLARYKTLAFGISAAYTGVAGSLFAHFLGYIGPDHFTVLQSIEYLAMIVLGGLGSILGSVLGAVVLTLLPEVLRLGLDLAREVSPGLLLPDLRAFVVGLVLILILIFEPEGLAGRWRKIQRYWRTWPF
jgi:branched-chain amino acid transport system permease protein